MAGYGMVCSLDLGEEEVADKGFRARGMRGHVANELSAIRQWEI